MWRFARSSRAARSRVRLGSEVTAKETLRRAIFEAWNSKLRALGFRGGKSSRMHRVLLDDDCFQVLELQWSRFNADDDARVRVGALVFLVLSAALVAFLVTL